MDRFFAFFGKLILGAILLTIVIGIGYMVGTTKYAKSLSTLSTPAVQTKVETIATPTTTVLATGTPIPTKMMNKKTITGGLSSGTSFTMYMVTIPDGWNEQKESVANVSDKLTLSKDDYSLSIYQAAFGGGGCVYKGEPEQMMAQTFQNFVQISPQFRRSWNDDPKQTMTTYVICQKGTDTSYGSPTQFGAINATSPNPADEKTLSEMDSIVASLQKQ